MIRCIVDRTKGFGNLKRCLIIAEALKKNHKILFVIDNEQLVINELKKRKLQFKIKPRTILPSFESSFISKIMESIGSEIAIIDMREYGEHITKQLRNYPVKTILLDDAWSKNAYADIIINGTPVSQYHKYKKKNKKCHIYVGTKYFIINEDFIKNKKQLSDIVDKKKYQIVISMGGSDPNDLTFFVTKSLLNLENVKLRIILGPLYHEHNNLLRLIKNQKNIKLIKSPLKIWNEFFKADLAISNAGNTLFELAIMRIPTMCISAVAHQIPYAEEFTKQHSALNVGFWKNVTDHKIRKNVEYLINNKKLRKIFSSSASRIIDGKGLSRVIKIIENID